MTAGGYHINWTPLGLALLLALLGFWLNHVGGRVEAVDTAGFTHDPDYIVEDFDALSFDVNGTPHQRLIAKRLTHYMDDDTTVLDKPIMRSLGDQEPVTVTAKRALLSSDGNQAYFMDNVRVERLSGDGQPPLTLETEYLHVSRDARTMRSNRPVLMRQGRSHVSANGMLADDRARLLSLDGNVRGTYEKTR